MMKKTRLKLTAILLCVLAITFFSANTVQAANTSKKSLTVTIDQENSVYTCKFNLTKSTKLNCKVKILGMTGKGKSQKIYWEYYETNLGKGSIFEYRKASELKKNKTYKLRDLVKFAPKTGNFTFDLPKGIEAMKLKITISTVGGKKTIKSFQEIETPFYYLK